MTEPLTIVRVQDALAGLGTATRPGERRIRFTTSPDCLRQCVGRSIRDLGCDHFIQIAAADTGKGLELHYHLTGPHRVVVTLVVPLPADLPSCPSVGDLLPPAALYERQVHDLMGVDFPGHPDLRRFLLNEDWPAGEHPMRKGWKPRPGTFYGGLKGKGA